MSCYDESYEDKIKKQEIIKKGSYLMKATCCDSDCDKLIDDIEHTVNECNNVFRYMHKDNLDPEGKTISGDLCSDLEEKKTILKRERSGLKGGIVKKSKKQRRKRRKTFKRRSRKTRNKKLNYK